MRIEVLVDNGEPEIYPLNKSEILIGSGEMCDIIVTSSGVSRKHLKVIVDGDQYFVADQGSTNGTFINEERLVPGRRTEFTSFFPVRLGDNVLLSLLSDEESEDSILKDFSKKETSAPPADATKVISLNNLNKSKTSDLVKKKELGPKKKVSSANSKKSKKEKASLVNGQNLFLLALVGGAVFYHFYTRPEPEAPPVAVTRPAGLPKNVQVVKSEEKKVDYKIPVQDLISRERMATFMTELKCFNEDEQKYCNLLPELNNGKGGVLKWGQDFVILIPQSDWLFRSNIKLPGPRQHVPADISAEVPAPAGMVVEAIKEPVEEPKPEKPWTDENFKVGFLEFIRERLHQAGIKNFEQGNFYLAFYDDKASDPVITKVMAVKGEAFMKIISRYNVTAIQNLKSYGFKSMGDIEAYFVYY